MGYVIPNLGIVTDCWGDGDDDIDAVLACGQGSPARHSGISLGRYSSAAARIGRPAALMQAALEGLEEFGDAVEALPTINSGPFPGVAPATWWGSLSSAEQSKLWRATVAKAARSSLV
jgi:hypothetical protein